MGQLKENLQANSKLNDETKINKIVGPITKRKKEKEKHNKTNKIVGGEQTSKGNAILQSRKRCLRSCINRVGPYLGSLF